MPGKVNPVIPEVVNQIAFEVIGNDITVSMAAEGGQLQLNAFEPMIAHSLFKSISHLAAGCPRWANAACAASPPTANARASCWTLDGAGHRAQPLYRLRHSSEIAKRGARHRQARLRPGAGKKLMTREQLDQILQPEILTQPHSFALPRRPHKPTRSASAAIRPTD